MPRKHNKEELRRRQAASLNFRREAVIYKLTKNILTGTFDSTEAITPAHAQDALEHLAKRARAEDEPEGSGSSSSSQHQTAAAAFAAAASAATASVETPLAAASLAAAKPKAKAAAKRSELAERYLAWRAAQDQARPKTSG